ncbi:sugar transferase [Nocardioides bigeumensis]|uniref:sugar transferase n=1 Tax=Nocardioides bigeumensis TaxID=433657 RepID=UPI0031D93725
MLTILLVTVVAAVGRNTLPFFESVGDIPENVSASAVFIVAGWLAALALSGAYAESHFAVGTEEYRRVFMASLAAAGLVGIGCYLAQFPLSRGFFVLLFTLGIPMLMLSRFLGRRVIQRLRRGGRLTRQILIAGAPQHVEALADVLMRESWLGYSIIGCLTADGPPPSETLTGIPVLGRTRDAERIVGSRDVDTLLIAEGAFEEGASLRQMAWDLEKHKDLEIAVAPSLTDVAAGRVEIRPVAGLPLVYIGHTRAQDSAHWAKRLFDIVGSVSLLLASFPFWAWAALRIKLHDGGPVLFRQTRVGLDGRTFECLKFRTMVIGAESMLPTMQGDDADHVLFKMQHDPRVTKAGRLLRRYSLDELPQLLNVLRGDMSLVGPRPPLPSEVERYEDVANRRLRVRPGLTGLWQISGRSSLSWDDTIRLDLYYVDNWSMVQDLVILAKTASAVMAARGAY